MGANLGGKNRLSLILPDNILVKVADQFRRLDIKINQLFFARFRGSTGSDILLGLNGRRQNFNISTKFLV